MRANLFGLGSDLKIKSYFDCKRCLENNLLISLTWIRIRIHQILWIRILIRIQSIRIHIPDCVIMYFHELLLTTCNLHTEDPNLFTFYIFGQKCCLRL